MDRRSWKGSERPLQRTTGKGREGEACQLWVNVQGSAAEPWERLEIKLFILLDEVMITFLGRRRAASWGSTEGGGYRGCRFYSWLVIRCGNELVTVNSRGTHGIARQGELQPAASTTLCRLPSP